MEVRRAASAGACYGVQRALDMAEAAVQDRMRVNSLGPLIHNPLVVQDLEQRGLSVVDSVEEVDAPAVLIRSHGVVPQVLQQAQEAGLHILDATCPHVARAQRAARELAQAGNTVLVVGESGHPEVAGLVEYARLYPVRVEVVATPEEIPDNLSDPVGIVVQTTQKRAALDAVVDALESRGLHPTVKKTICSATTKRQDAASALAGEVDAMVVIGGRNSSNTTRLFQICQESCSRTFHVESADELQASDFRRCRTVGVTAGASTPENQILQVERVLATF